MCGGLADPEKITPKGVTIDALARRNWSFPFVHGDGYRNNQRLKADHPPSCRHGLPSQSHLSPQEPPERPAAPSFGIAAALHTPIEHAFASPRHRRSNCDLNPPLDKSSIDSARSIGQLVMIKEEATSQVENLQDRLPGPSDQHIVRGAFLQTSPSLVVDLRGGHVPMAEQHLHLDDIDPCIEKERCGRRSERMRRVLAVTPLVCPRRLRLLGWTRLVRSVMTPAFANSVMKDRTIDAKRGDE